ncbi:hypothetical protein [Winogradskyella aurantiaca]|uniref:hypothetical protein n=1 Tax=Winogradskyella aurantiaca TaxID=2219558 RepID=UPI000E1C7967|nr:hypothetical protein [Winogradskyella aurantiaca]
MTLQKISKIIVAILGLLGVIFLVRIISAGDDAIKSGEEAGLVDPMAYIAYVVLGVILVLVIFFVLKNLFTNTKSLKNTLIGIGAFAAVIIISYVAAGGDPMEYKLQDGIATDGQSHMVGTGLIAFYILLAVAAISMIFSGVKKVISK